MKTRYNPNEEGNVYVISNKAIVNPETKNPLTKIGRTNKKNPEDRINSMNKETPVPQNFDINGIVKTDAPNVVEKTVHKYFENEHFNKEYFKVNPKKAVETVKSISEDVEQHSFCLPDTSCDIPEGEESFCLKEIMSLRIIPLLHLVMLFTFLSKMIVLKNWIKIRGKK